MSPITFGHPTTKWRALAAVLLGALLVATGWNAAWANSTPGTLGPLPATLPVDISEPVTDPAGFLSTEQAGQVRNAIARTTSRGVNTKFVLVPDFSGYDPTDWCAQSANQTETLSNTVVFVLAYEERDSSWCTNIADNSSLLSDAQIDNAWDAALTVAARSNPMEPPDAADVGVAFMTSLENTLDGVSQKSELGLGNAFWVFAGAITLIALTLVLMRSANKKKRLQKAGQVRFEGDVNPQERIDLAQKQLLASDELLRAASDEVLFAQAELGFAYADKLNAAVKNAQASLGDAFALLPTMEEQKTLPGKAKVASSILDLLAASMPAVYEAQQELKVARDRQMDASQRLTDTRARISDARAQAVRSERTLADLRTRFAPQQLRSLEPKLTQASAFLRAASENCAEAEQVMNSDRAAAVDALDRAASQLSAGLMALQTIDTADATITQSNEILGAAIASITSDLEDVDRLAVSQANFAPLVQDARDAVQTGVDARNGQSDPLAALEKLRSAEDALDRALDPLRSSHEQQLRNQTLAQERISAAQAMVTQAQTAMTSARSYSGLEARSALSSAQSHLAAARTLQSTDATAAVSEANSALSAAQSTLGILNSTPPPRQVNHRSSGNNSLLWGMVLGNMMGNNRRYSQRTSWGSPTRGSGYGGSTRSTRATGSSRSAGGYRGSSRTGGGFGGSRGSSGGFRGGGGGFRSSGGGGSRGGGGRGKF